MGKWASLDEKLATIAFSCCSGKSVHHPMRQAAEEIDNFYLPSSVETSFGCASSFEQLGVFEECINHRTSLQNRAAHRQTRAQTQTQTQTDTPPPPPPPIPIVLHCSMRRFSFNFVFLSVCELFCAYAI